MAEDLIQIDGNKFEVRLSKISRKADILDKYARRTMSGDLEREIIGTYFNYNVEFAFCDEPLKYLKLWNIIIKPQTFHNITIVHTTAYISFRGYISNVKDNVTFANPFNDYDRRFDKLSFDIVSKEPEIRA